MSRALGSYGKGSYGKGSYGNSSKPLSGVRPVMDATLFGADLDCDTRLLSGWRLLLCMIPTFPFHFIEDRYGGFPQFTIIANKGKAE
jgi:hypothetical protein